MKKLYIKYFIMLSAISILLTSCKVGEKYDRSKMELPSDVFGTAYNSSDTTNIATISWREFFKDPKLQALIEEGLKNNYDLQIATTKIKQAEAVLGESKYALLPTANIYAQYAGDNAPDSQGGANIDNYQLGISASWEADIWGKLRSQKKASIANLMSSEAYRRVVQTSLISNIAKNYYLLQSLDKQVEITNRSIELQKKNAELMNSLKRAGFVTGADVEQSKALEYATRASIPDLQQSIQETESTLNFLIGKSPGSINRSSLTKTLDFPTLAYGIPAQLLSYRPDVQQAEQAFVASLENENIAKSMLYPSLSLSAKGGYSTLNSLDNFFSASNLLTNLVGNLTMPIINGKKLKSNLAISAAQREESFLNFKSSILSAGHEVSIALSSFDNAQKKEENRTKQINALQKTQEYTKALLTYNGNATDVNNAEERLLTAELSKVNDQLAQLNSVVELYRALGGGAY